MSALRNCIAGVALALLAGCATPSMTKMSQGIEGDRRAAHDERSKIDSRQEAYFQEVDSLWVGGDTPIQIDKGETQPRSLDADVVFQRQYPVTLQMLAEWIGTTTGLPVTVTADAVASAAEAAYDPISTMLRRNGQATGVALANNSASAAGNGKDAAAGSFVIQYQGKVRGLLDEASARTGNAWVYRNGRVVILNTDTRVFQLHALPGKSSVSATVTNQSQAGGQGGGSGGGGSSGGSGSGGQGSNMSQSASSGQTTTMESEVEGFETVAKTVSSMLSPKGKVATAASTGSIAVTDVPAVLDRVQSYIEQTNRRLTRQVVVDVKVYSVELSHTESYGLDWQLVWKTLAGKYNITTSLGGGAAENANSLNVGVIDNGRNNFGGSNVLLKALSEQGDVSIKTSAAVATLSNQPVPVQVAEETSYLAQSQTDLVANAGASTSLTAGSVVTGFTMNVLPIVLDNNDLLMQLQINMSTLRGMRTIESGGSMIEVPTVDARQFLQRVKLESGQTLVMGGYEQETTKTTDNGMGTPKFTLFGGSRNADRQHTVLVVTLTPKVTD